MIERAEATYYLEGMRVVLRQPITARELYIASRQSWMDMNCDLLREPYLLEAYSSKDLWVSGGWTIVNPDFVTDVVWWTFPDEGFGNYSSMLGRFAHVVETLRRELG